MQRTICAEDQRAISHLDNYYIVAPYEETELTRYRQYYHKIKKVENLKEIESPRLFTTVIYHNGAWFRVSLRSRVI